MWKPGQRIPSVVVRCYREWVAPFAQRGTSCGLCGAREFEFVRILPESEWPKVPEPSREVSA